jgi:hypothetical protein
MKDIPAFPSENYSLNYGMTLRDYFAAKAMQSFLTGDYDLYPHEAAQKAYELAEAMLKARDE